MFKEMVFNRDEKAAKKIAKVVKSVAAQLKKQQRKLLMKEDVAALLKLCKMNIYLFRAHLASELS